MKAAKELFRGFTNTMYDGDLIMYEKDFKAALKEHNAQIIGLIHEMIADIDYKGLPGLEGTHNEGQALLTELKEQIEMKPTQEKTWEEKLRKKYVMPANQMILLEDDVEELMRDINSLLQEQRENKKDVLKRIRTLLHIIDDSEIGGFSFKEANMMKKLIKEIRNMNTIELTQDVFNGKPDEVDFACVDYDGLLSFGKALNPRYTWASERWRGFELIGEQIELSDYEPLTSIKRVLNAPPPTGEKK